jgi:Family of unknown function (DUF5670)
MSTVALLAPRSNYRLTSSMRGGGFVLPPFLFAAAAQHFECYTLRRREVSMLLYIGLGILVLWILGFIAFHVTLGLIHILPILALALIITHFIRRRPTN